MKRTDFESDISIEQGEDISMVWWIVLTWAMLDRVDRSKLKTDEWTCTREDPVSIHAIQFLQGKRRPPWLTYFTFSSADINIKFAILPDRCVIVISSSCRIIQFSVVNFFSILPSVDIVLKLAEKNQSIVVISRLWNHPFLSAIYLILFFFFCWY